MGSEADILFDFEEANQASCAREGGARSPDAALEALAHRVELAARHPSELARQLFSDVAAILRRMQTCLSATEVLLSLASALTRLGYNVIMRNALGGGTRECFGSLRHEFLVVRGTGDFCGMEFIVEPSLRQHFAIPHPSPEYDYVLSRTPDVFVGGSCRLVSIVQLLCALMADSFTRQGVPLPPWRTEAAILSKWLPNPARTRDLMPRAAGNLSPHGIKSSLLELQQQHQQHQQQQLVLQEQQESQQQPPSCDEDAHSTEASAPVLVVKGGCPADVDTSSVCCIRAVADLLPSPPQPLGVTAALTRLSALSWSVTGPIRSILKHGPCQQAAVVVGFEVCDGGRAAAARAASRDPLSPTPPDCGPERVCNGSGWYDVIPLPYTKVLDELADDLDECASAGDDTASFLLASETSGRISHGQMYDAPSLTGSPTVDAAGAAAVAVVAAGCGGGAATAVASCFRGDRRPTATGMLPLPNAAAGLLSARLIFEPLAAGAAAAAVAMPPSPPSPPPSKAPVAAGAGLQRPPMLPPSSPAPPQLFGLDCRETCPLMHPGAPAVQLIRRAAGGEKGGAGGRYCGSAAPPPRRAREAAEWLPWGPLH